MVLEAVDFVYQCPIIRAALITFCPVIMKLVQFVALVAFGYVVVMVEALNAGNFILFRGGVVATVPVVAVDNEDIFGVQVITVQLPEPHFLFLQCFLHAAQLLLWVYNVNRPLLTALLLANSSQSGGNLRIRLNSF